eukprot:Selendium_serpulae@DN9300_c0_g1_i1.p1
MMRIPEFKTFVNHFNVVPVAMQGSATGGVGGAVEDLDTSPSDQEIIDKAHADLRQKASPEIAEEIPQCGKYRGPAVKIETIGRPVKGRVRSLSPVMKKEVERQLESQLREDVIQPSTSEWASPPCTLR